MQILFYYFIQNEDYRKNCVRYFVVCSQNKAFKILLWVLNGSDGQETITFNGRNMFHLEHCPNRAVYIDFKVVYTFFCGVCLEDHIKFTWN